jgi:hypothetical protein
VGERPREDAVHVDARPLGKVAVRVQHGRRVGDGHVLDAAGEQLREVASGDGSLVADGALGEGAGVLPVGERLGEGDAAARRRTT